MIRLLGVFSEEGVLSMSWMKGRKSSRTIFMAAAAISCVVGAIILNTRDQAVEASKAVAKPMAASPAAVFPANAGTLGAIPDNTCTGPGRSVTFTVSGLTGAPSNIVVNFTSGSPAHSWVGDVDTVLLAPGGAPTHEIFTFTNPAGSGFGDDSNLAGPYNFFDAAAGNWWAAATAATSVQPVAAGDYRTASPTGTNTSMNPVFAGVANPNGTWTLRFNDCAQGDTGGITAANLTIETASAPSDAQLDYDGDGRSDHVVVRNVGGGANGQVRWFINPNSGGATQSYDWGLASDFFVAGDFDGDAKDDIAVWRAGAPEAATFFILNSQTSTARVEAFGQTGDDPTVVGDYDGDGKADLAVYRAGGAGQQSTWYYRGSLNNPGGNVAFVPWGIGGDFPAPGDYDGDGKYDFVVQRGGSPTVFWRLFATGATSAIPFGGSSDLIVPGDYDGDGATDIAVVRVSGGNFQWWYYGSNTNTGVYATTFGNSATDFVLAGGDYDGDGRADFGVWRSGVFWYQSSASLAVSNNSLGAAGDYPVANFSVH